MKLSEQEVDVLLELIKQDAFVTTAKVLARHLKALSKRANKKQDAPVEHELFFAEAMRMASKGCCFLEHGVPAVADGVPPTEDFSQQEVLQEVVDGFMLSHKVPASLRSYVENELSHRASCKSCVYGKGIHEAACSFAGNYISRTRCLTRALWGKLGSVICVSSSAKQKCARGFLLAHDKYKMFHCANKSGEARGNRLYDQAMDNRALKRAKTAMHEQAVTIEHLSCMGQLRARLG